MPVTIGIIYPPPEVRSIVDKTATFVARNGPEFEEKIRGNEINNTKFNFLNSNDPYHAYYQHKVKEIAEGKDPSESAPQSSMPQTSLTNAIQTNMENMNLSAKAKESQSKIIEKIIIPKEPPADFEFIVDAPSIQPLDIDVIKLTAQFVARNGGPFRTNLMNKESRNPLFDFLKPQHSHFTFFTRLVEQYTRILLPARDVFTKLQNEVENPYTVLNDVAYRVEWKKIQLREKAKIDEMVEKERIAYAQIDWHDFVVVETVDYQPNEQGNFPPPTTPADVGARTLALERIESSNPDGSKIDYNSKLLMNRIIEDESRVEISNLSAEQEAPVNTGNKVTLLVDKNIDEVAMDEDSDDENKSKKLSKKDVPLPPNPEHVIIRKDYDPKAKQQTVTAKAVPDTYFKSPLTGELIPASSMSEHMRISMLDPRWLEQKQREKREKEDQEEVLASGFNIEENLKRLAEYRSDVFGKGDDEVIIGKKVGEEEPYVDNNVIWESQATTTAGAKRTLTGTTVEDQLRTIQGIAEEDSKGAPKMGQMPPHMLQQSIPQMPPMNQGYKSFPNIPTHPAQQQQQPAPVYEAPRVSQQLTDVVEESAPKRQKTEEQLIPEATFLETHSGSVRFNVQIPNMPDKPEWNLKGQLIPFTMPWTETVASIKQKLVEYLNMAIAKQKLQYDGMFIKDTNSLAFYNLPDNAVIYLQMKERGGRKK